jgi:hypothetical protein
MSVYGRLQAESNSFFLCQPHRGMWRLIIFVLMALQHSWSRSPKNHNNKSARLGATTSFRYARQFEKTEHTGTVEKP